MKSLYQLLFMVGLALTVTGVVLWTKAGFPLSLNEISTILFGARPWSIGKDSYLFLIILGFLLLRTQLSSLISNAGKVIDEKIASLQGEQLL